MPPTPCGASGDADGIVDDEPMCMQSVTPVSLHTSKTGSQSPVWIARQAEVVRQLAEADRAHAALGVAPDLLRPRARTSHSGMMQSGMFMPPDGAHHSSTIQSL